jgi:hypothetical protein
MCPDPQLLSIYLDGELPSPWKEKIQAHFAQCPICREKLENFKKLKELFKNDKSSCRTYVERIAGESRTYTEQELIEAKERVWKNIESRRSYTPRFGLLRQKISIPLPAAAAAAIVILLLTVFWLRGPGGDNHLAENTENTNFILATEMDRIDELPVMLPAADMSGVLQYLASDGANIIIFQLPENKNFFRSGEPAIIKAADFTQNTFSGNGNPRGRREENFGDGTPRRQPR